MNEGNLALHSLYIRFVALTILTVLTTLTALSTLTVLKRAPKSIQKSSNIYFLKDLQKFPQKNLQKSQHFLQKHHKMKFSFSSMSTAGLLGPNLVPIKSDNSRVADYKEN